MHGDSAPVRRALLSVSDKTDLVPFARGLHEAGVMLISTGGTAAVLRAAGLPVCAVDEITGVPEMMDGRVKTLHPAIHGGLLARRDRPAHREAMQAHGIEPIDLVCINLYPFERTISEGAASEAEAIEQIDIGGPAMLRSAAKNHDFVTVVTSAAQYDRVISEIRANEGATTLELRRELAAAAFARTAEYDTAISAWMGGRYGGGALPETLQLHWTKVRNLRYGENPHQKAAVYREPAPIDTGAVSARVLHGKPLSYNNLLDAAAALELARDLRDAFPGRRAAVIVKHTNPCGAAVAAGLEEAFDRAYAGDTLAAYGGILALSDPVDEATTARITSGERFLEVVIAPGFAAGCAEQLGARWPNVRLLATGGPDRPRPMCWSYRSVAGGLLVQEADLKPANVQEWRRVAGPQLEEAGLDDAVFTWTAVKHIKSNAVAIGAGGRLLGAGPGQVDRVSAARIAIEKAGERIAAMAAGGHAVVAASDAFFPFADGPALLIDAGIRCLIHPGGSRRDDETIELCAKRGVTCLLTGVRHFRH